MKTPLTDKNEFEIHFPKRFTRALKLLRLLPYRLYFAAVHRFTAMIAACLEELVRYYESLTPQSWPGWPISTRKTPTSKDAFNEVHALAEIFAKMFHAVESHRFAITERIVGEQSVALTWDFDFGLRGAPLRVRGASVLRFCADGRVTCHRD